MKISIIIPCLNQITELITCLRLISKQRFDDFETIVIDGGSVNFNEFNLNEIFKDVTFISESDKNIYDAMNKGIAKANGEWLYFMGVDDSFYNFDVLNAIAPFFSEGKVKLILGQIVYRFINEDSFFVRRNNGLVKPVWSKKLWLRNTLPHQGIFYHNSIFDNQNYDIRYDVLSDYAINLNLWKQRVPVLILDKIIASCSTNGISKKYNLKLYMEEVNLKTRASSIFLKPFFIVLALAKNIIKKF